MLIYSLCIGVFITWLYVAIIQKNFFHVITFLMWGFFFPLFLYQVGWSSLINKTPSYLFDYVMVVIALIVIAYSLLTSHQRVYRLKKSETVAITKFGNQIAIFLNVLFIVLYLLENYLVSGSLIPGLVGIDIHNRASVPIISYITNASFLFMGFDYLAYRSTKKKRYLLFLIIVTGIPVITRSARMMMVISIIQLLCLYFLVEDRKNLVTIKDRVKNRRTKLILFFLAIAIAVGLINFTNYRMSGYGKYDIDYQSNTQWSGPKWLNWFSPYYGYFPLSFNNLKINLLYNNSVVHNWIGLYSLTALYFGIFQFDNILGINGYAYMNNVLSTSGAANVPTGIWNYYYDFGYFFFIPILIALFIISFFRKKSYKIEYKFLYCWYVTDFAFISFQNTLYMSTALVVGIIMYFVIKYSFKIVEKD